MINTEIKSKTVRLITKDENKIIKTSEALNMAKTSGLDLICIKDEETPICKIGDYSKYLYEQKKKERENKKKQKPIEIKEIRIGDSTGLNDLRTKAKMIDKFLANNNKVKLSVKYKGRLIRNIEEGPKKIEELTNLIKEKFIIDSPAKIVGNTVTMTIVHKK